MGKLILKEILLGFAPWNSPGAGSLSDYAIQTCFNFRGFSSCTCVSFGRDLVPGAAFRATHFYLDYTGLPGAI